MRMRCIWRKALALLAVLVLSLSLTVQAEETTPELDGEIQEEGNTTSPEETAPEGQEVTQAGPVEPWITLRWLGNPGTRSVLHLDVNSGWDGAPAIINEIIKEKETLGPNEEPSKGKVFFWIVGSKEDGEKMPRGDQYVLLNDWEAMVAVAASYTSEAYSNGGFGTPWDEEHQTGKTDEERVQFREGAMNCYQGFLQKIHTSAGANGEETADVITTASGVYTEKDGSITPVTLQVNPGTVQYIPELEKLKPSLDTVIASTSSGFRIAGIYDISVVNAVTGANVKVDSSVNIKIPYPAGFGARDNFMIFHYNNGTGRWENVPVKGKDQEGILCSVNSLSPFAVVSSKAVENTGNNPAPAPSEPTGSSSGSSGSGDGAGPESAALTNIPQTGDRFPMEWLLVLAVGAAVVMSVELYAKRKKDC